MTATKGKMRLKGEGSKEKEGVSSAASTRPNTRPESAATKVRPETFTTHRRIARIGRGVT